MKKLWNWILNQLRKSLSIKKPDISIETILDVTGGPAKVNRGYYTSFSGVDVKIYLESENGNFLCVPEIHAVSCLDNPEDKVRGTIISIIFDGDTLTHLPFKPKNMLMVACNEYGALCYTRFKNIVLGARSWGISIDDIIGEVRVDFEAESCVHWKNVTNLRRYEDWPDNLPEQIQERLKTYV